MKSPDLILFAKQPTPGEVKTRLQPDYSPEQAAQIAEFLIRDTAKLAATNWPSDVYFYAAPDADHPFFRRLAEEFHLHLATQANADLGLKMLTALRQGIERSGAAGVLGCDVPHCRGAILELAHEKLARRENVIGPTEDGGYYFIGLQQAPGALFEHIEWGGSRVFETTLLRAQQLGIAFEVLPKLTDIDTRDDLWITAHQYEPLRKFLYDLLAGNITSYADGLR
ncbi:MAG: TIGR04282 family arsenosugar biosynthesis glycosyltransferase [Gammaproteobacteria bacterium]|jgi:rSAM/selenodomain-associated transferase 1|nr:TIGR04282 family arsenosugar biosynthesis glycosyltransferase [Gammaproteobacteria bacterium]